MSSQSLIQEGATLKMQIEAMTSRLREINAALATEAEFKNGKKTGYLVGDGYKVKVVLRDNVKWDQEKLAQVISHLPVIQDCFRTEYKPDSKKLELAMARSEEVEKAIVWARTITPGTPAVTYEPIQEQEQF